MAWRKILKLKIITQWTASLNIRLVITDERSESREDTQNGEGKRANREGLIIAFL